MIREWEYLYFSFLFELLTQSLCILHMGAWINSGLRGVNTAVVIYWRLWYCLCIQLITIVPFGPPRRRDLKGGKLHGKWELSWISWNLTLEKSFCGRGRMKMTDKCNFVLKVLFIQAALLQHWLVLRQTTHTLNCWWQVHTCNMVVRLSRHKTLAFRWDSHIYS